MAITATFYKFSKEKSSTKRPTGGTSKNINIKDPCSVLNPAILLDGSNPTEWNYCYIPSFDRYYFISDWTSDHNMWLASLSVDVLASWRTSILNSYQYVLRSTNKFDAYLGDSLYPLTDKKEYHQVEFSGDDKCFNTANYTYVIGVMNGLANAHRLGGVTYYTLTGAQLQKLMNALLGNADYLGQNGQFPTLFGITKEVMQALVNPTQYIVDSYLLPYSIPFTQSSKLTVGWWTLPGFSDDVSQVTTSNTVYRNVFYSKDYVLSHHPQIERGAYMDGAPFSTLRISCGPFGDVDIDTNMLVYTTPTINFTVAGDYQGNVELIVTGKPNGQIITRREACVKVPFKIGQMFQDRLGMAKQAIGVATNNVQTGLSMAEGNISSAINAGTSATLPGYIIDSAQTSMPKLAISGDNGALYDINRTWILQQEFTYAVEDVPGHRGKPLCQTIQLSEVEGYALCANAEIEFACYETEHDAIINYLQTGVYIE